ncbi:hypothetical protein [Amycolatopsis sp. CA-128772]|uniref:hypothetical protein n=1 Tax=Amycolatopsis sp. CA-128772 TaxID=2073159 RepID=UPI000CCFF723|nr:hypothetical protein [Amycolatopsis sp. CA-128772]
MTDVDELRHALRAQESMAPDPGAVLTAATRRIRRRRTAGVTAMALAVAAVAAAAVGVPDRSVPPAAHVNLPPAELPVTDRVPPPAPAVSLEDSAWDLMVWAVQPHYAGVHYGQAHRYAFEIELRDGPAPHSALPEKPSAAAQLTHPQTVLWQDGPARWIRVQTSKPVTAAEMLALLAKIRTTPPVIHSPLKAVQVPAGQKVTTFTSEPETNTLVLCPDPEAPRALLDTRCFSLTAGAGPPVTRSVDVHRVADATRPGAVGRAAPHDDREGASVRWGPRHRPLFSCEKTLPAVTVRTRRSWEAEPSGGSGGVHASTEVRAARLSAETDPSRTTTRTPPRPAGGHRR